jgi:hypothetical protein
MASSGGVPTKLVDSIKDPSAPFDSIVKAIDCRLTSRSGISQPSASHGEKFQWLRAASELCRAGVGEVATASMGVELTMMDLDTAKYLVLDKVAPHLWGHLDSPICVRDLLAAAGRRYEVTSERCQSDVPSR